MMFESKTICDAAWNRQRLRVPRADETLLAQPSMHEAEESARRNRSHLENCRVDLQGRTLTQLREWSRRQALAAARTYTAELTGQAVDGQPDELLYVGGHQPALFHAGVWVKNFAIGELASRSQGRALNLIIDNDTYTNSGVRAPVGTRSRPEVRTVRFDADGPAQPWEEAIVRDRSLFETFGARVGRLMSKWEIEPLVTEIWPAAVRAVDRTGRLRDGLTAARLSAEHSWGLTNLELPISRMCGLDPFLWFASHLLANLPRFHETYNGVLKEFRQVNGIRSQSHPVPELTVRGDWFEAPFWVWREGDERRNHLFAKQSRREIHLSDGSEVFARLRLDPDSEACCAVEVLRDLPDRGIRLRTRALTTTLFARLCLADLFVHGIGGAKYDEMTDCIMMRFFGIEAPEFQAVSTTLHLPLAEPYDVARADVVRLRSLLRDLEYNSDRHLSPDQAAAVGGLIDEKRRLIAEQTNAAQSGRSRRERRRQSRLNRERYRRFRDINRRLSELTIGQRQQIEAELAGLRAQLDANAVLTDREYAFCLFPAEKLRGFMQTLWQRANNASGR